MKRPGVIGHLPRRLQHRSEVAGGLPPVSGSTVSPIGHRSSYAKALEMARLARDPRRGWTAGDNHRKVCFNKAGNLESE